MDNFEIKTQDTSLDTYVSSVMKRVYMKMFLALVVTTITAYICGTSAEIMGYMLSNPFVYWGLLLGELAMVFTISGAINKLSETSATLLFYVYSILNGAVFSIILLAYTASSVYQTFFITAGVFGAMSIYGYFTKNDLTRFGSFLYMALIGLIIAIVVNIFLASSALDWMISFIGVGIFIGLTAWDTQKIKKMAAMSDNSTAGKLATLGALSLYLDFVNLFLYLLRFFGNSRN
ncbi:MAG: Bax inhibitor-1/YccA family protein [Muribaculaceae bacterium]|nr:Bax inhibitor-1/YccA family protein [Muribaculaceae bacterium]